MYRHDYGDGAQNVQAPVSKALRLYDADYYVINKDFRVYICIENGSTGSVDPQKSLNEPIHTGVGIPLLEVMDIDGNIYLQFLHQML